MWQYTWLSSISLSLKYTKPTFPKATRFLLGIYSPKHRLYYRVYLWIFDKYREPMNSRMWLSGTFGVVTENIQPRPVFMNCESLIARTDIWERPFLQSVITVPIPMHRQLRKVSRGSNEDWWVQSAVLVDIISHTWQVQDIDNWG